jgi:hypothetical protein
MQRRTKKTSTDPIIRKKATKGKASPHATTYRDPLVVDLDNAPDDPEDVYDSNPPGGDL